MNEFHEVFLRSYCVPSWFIHLEMGGMLLDDGVGTNCKMGATTEVKAQEPSIWAKKCIVGDCASVIGLDMSTPPSWRENVMEYNNKIFTNLY